MLPYKSADILLVEDDANDAELALTALRERSISKNVVHVMDGNEALDFVYFTGMFADWQNSKAPRLILLDLKLKTVNGLDVLRQLKSEDRTKTIPVVVFTSCQQDIEMVESYRLGVNSYVIKPTDFKAYAQAVGDIAHYWLSINQPPAA